LTNCASINTDGAVFHIDILIDGSLEFIAVRETFISVDAAGGGEEEKKEQE
jgi:hypothetical protein